MELSFALLCCGGLLRWTVPCLIHVYEWALEKRSEKIVLRRREEEEGGRKGKEMVMGVHVWRGSKGREREREDRMAE